MSSAKYELPEAAEDVQPAKDHDGALLPSGTLPPLPNTRAD